MPTSSQAKLSSTSRRNSRNSLRDLKSVQNVRNNPLASSLSINSATLHNKASTNRKNVHESDQLVVSVSCIEDLTNSLVEKDQIIESLREEITQLKLKINDSNTISSWKDLPSFSKKSATDACKWIEGLDRDLGKYPFSAKIAQLASYHFWKKGLVSPISRSGFHLENSVEDFEISLLCPIRKVRMKNPIKFWKCKHRECFELETLIYLIIKSTPDKKLKCPICNINFDFEIIKSCQSRLLKVSSSRMAEPNLYFPFLSDKELETPFGIPSPWKALPKG